MIHITITHTAHYALSYCVIEKASYWEKLIIFDRFTYFGN
jgi:hypothetical protein